MVLQKYELKFFCWSILVKVKLASVNLTRNKMKGHEAIDELPDFTIASSLPFYKYILIPGCSLL